MQSAKDAIGSDVISALMLVASIQLTFLSTVVLYTPIEGAICPEHCVCSDQDGDLYVDCTSLPDCVPDGTIGFSYINREAYFNPDFSCSNWRHVRHVNIDCDDINPSTKTFAGLNGTEYFRLRVDSSIDAFAPGFFEHFTQLLSLDLTGNNWFTFDEMIPMLRDLGHSPLEVLNLSQTNYYTENNLVTFIGDKFLTAIDKLKLRVFNISTTGTTLLQCLPSVESGFDWFNTLEVLDLSYSTFLEHPNLNYPADMFSSHPILQNIKTLYASGLYKMGVMALAMPNQCTKGISKRWSKELSCNPRAAFPPKLESFYMHGLNGQGDKCFEAPQKYGYAFCFSAHNSLRYISVRGDIKAINAMFVGLTSMHTFDIRDSSLEFISNTTLMSFPHLSTILLGGNSLWKCDASVMEDLLVFNKKLEQVDLSSNELTNLGRFMFEDNKQIRVIDLSNNKLTDLSLELGGLNELELLNISGNEIASISEQTFRQLRHIQRPIKKPFIDMSGNLFDCSCETKETIGRIRDMKDSLIGNKGYHCSYKGQLVRIDTITVDDLEHLCLMRVLSLCLPPILSLVTLIIAVILCYIFRAHIFKLYVRCRLWRYRNKRIMADQRVFLTYCAKDKEVVLGQIYPKLNVKLQEHTGREGDVLYINDKDFRVPGNIDEEIVRGVDSTRATLAIVSKNFLRSAWTQLEVTYSWIEKRPIILVFLENVPEKDMSPVLRYFYNKKVRLVWSEKVLDGGIFWDTLVASLLDVLCHPPEGNIHVDDVV